MRRGTRQKDKQSNIEREMCFSLLGKTHCLVLCNNHQVSNLIRIKHCGVKYIYFLKWQHLSWRQGKDEGSRTGRLALTFWSDEQRLPLFSKVSEIYQYLIAVISLPVLVFRPKQKQLNVEKDKRVVVIYLLIWKTYLSLPMCNVCVFFS